MKKDILKIAGVKSEAEFYKLYPTEEAFMKAHGKEFKKAKMGKAMVKKQAEQLVDFGNPPKAQPGAQVNNFTSSWRSLFANTPDPSAVAGGYNAIPTTPQSQQGAPPQGSFYPVQPATDLKGQAFNAIAKNPLSGIKKQDLEKEKSKIEEGLQDAQNLVGGIQSVKAERDAMKQAKQLKLVSDVTLKAASTRPEQSARRYVRPEDSLIQPQQLYPSYGTSYEILSAEDGAAIGGNPTEIQNTYDPLTLYSNLGYEPLSDSDEKLKQYALGGILGDLKNAGADELGNIGGTLGSFIGGGRGATTGGATIGSTIGKNVGKFIPIPGASQALSLVGGLIGGIAGGKTAKNTRMYNEQAQSNADLMSIQNTMANMNSGYMEDGGWISHNWQPQVITQFGGYKLKDLLKPDETMDTLRTGGNIRQNNMYPQDQYAMGGELKTHWGGYPETLSYNPYLPGTGETVMFRGQSHDESDGKGRTGIGVSYGDTGTDAYQDYAEYGTEAATDKANVEVERNEPAVQLGDEMHVFGNLKIPNFALSELGDPKAKGKKFKTYVADLSKKEQRLNKIIDKSVDGIDNLDVTTPSDRLKFNSFQMMQQGAMQKLQDIAGIKQRAANIQSAINETAEERGLVADDLAQGKIKIDKEAQKRMAKWGDAIEKAKNGTPKSRSPYFELIKKYFPQSEWENAYKIMMAESGGRPDAVNENKTKSGKVSSRDVGLFQINDKYHPEAYKDDKIKDPEHNVREAARIWKQRGWKEWAASKKVFSPNYKPRPGYTIYGQRYEEPGDTPQVTPTPVPTTPTPTTPPATTEKPKQAPPTTTPTTTKRPGLLDVASGILPYLRRPYQEQLDAAQLYPEMLALATNQLEPVQAQLYQPDLATPYSISLQDQLNEVTAQQRQAERLAGGNPAALAAIAAQSNRAKSSILGEQLRQNQAMQQGVYNANRQLLNEAKLKNLAILDQQYVRQATARSNTKAVTQEALSSIADKIAKNKLENREFAAYSNMFPQYGFDANMRAYNQGLTTFNVPAVSGVSTEELERELAARKEKAKKKEGEARNGRIVKAIKNL